MSFKELGWDDWILAPSGYHAGYCRGSCDSLYINPDVHDTAYSHIIEEIRRINEVGTITNCCAPTKLLPMTLIYVTDKGALVKIDLPKMLVDECGCA